MRREYQTVFHILSGHKRDEEVMTELQRSIHKKLETQCQQSEFSDLNIPAKAKFQKTTGNIEGFCSVIASIVLESMIMVVAAP